MRGTVMLSPSTSLRIDSARHLILAMALMGLWFAACGGGDAAPGGGVAEGEGDECKTDDATAGCEGEGPVTGEGEGANGGEGEGDTPRPLGADGEPCGGASGNECQDGLRCGAETEEPGICTCPQWFEGTWWAEFSEVRRTDGEEYDFSGTDIDIQFWMDQEVTFEQDGCNVHGPGQRGLWSGNGIGRVDQPTHEFFYERGWDAGDNMEHPLRSTGHLSEDKRSVNGTCNGEYPSWSTDRSLFPITCTFTLTRRE